MSEQDEQPEQPKESEGSKHPRPGTLAENLGDFSGCDEVSVPKRVWTDQQIAHVLYTEGLTAKVAAERFGVSERSIYSWQEGQRRPGIAKEMERLAMLDRGVVDRQISRWRRMAVTRMVRGLMAQKSDEADHKAVASYGRILLEEYARVRGLPSISVQFDPERARQLLHDMWQVAKVEPPK